MNEFCPNQPGLRVHSLRFLLVVRGWTPILSFLLMMPSASVTNTISSASSASARMKAVVSLPPLPRVVILPSLVLPKKPATTGMAPFSIMGQDALADVEYAVTAEGVGILED